MSAFPGSPYILAGLFLLFVATTVAGAVLAVSTPRIIRSVIGLATSSIGLAGLYYFLNSPFLALMEILIYVGAVCVTIIFAIMLAEPDEPAPEGRRGRTWAGAAAMLVVSGIIFWGIARLGLTGNWTTVAIRNTDGRVERIGVELLTTYSLAFEVISIVLLVAILGALAIARVGRHREE
ncbi:MAG: NADH-quinone oxidoreductase subunit J [Opitutaceae bacterium]|nr:NADH-quinone oxidoreductase subunit J [Opitutaceae bacterium]